MSFAFGCGGVLCAAAVLILVVVVDLEMGVLGRGRGGAGMGGHVMGCVCGLSWWRVDEMGIYTGFVRCWGIFRFLIL